MAPSTLPDQRAVDAATAAGALTAQYCRLDPVFYIERSAIAGVQFVLTDAFGFGTNFLDADLVEASFLDGWLEATPGARTEVEHLLRQRGCLSI